MEWARAGEKRGRELEVKGSWGGGRWERRLELKDKGVGSMG